MRYDDILASVMTSGAWHGTWAELLDLTPVQMAAIQAHMTRR